MPYGCLFLGPENTQVGKSQLNASDSMWLEASLACA